MKMIGLLLCGWTMTMVALSVMVDAQQQQHHQEACPGIRIAGNSYILDKKELHSLTLSDKNCQYSDFKFRGSTFNPSVAIQAEYWCSSHSGNYDCEGFLLNRDYIFWDDQKQSFIDPPKCDFISGMSLDSCQAVLDTGICDPSFFNCQAGLFNCKRTTGAYYGAASWCQGRIDSYNVPLQVCPTRVEFCEDLEEQVSKMKCDCSIKGGTRFTCYDDYRECDGIIQPTFTCPPPETERIYQVGKYCGQDYKLITSQHYQCYQNGKVVCDGHFHVDSKVAGTRPLNFNQALENYHEEYGEEEDLEGGMGYTPKPYIPMDFEDPEASGSWNVFRFLLQISLCAAVIVAILQGRKWYNERSTVLQVMAEHRMEFQYQPQEESFITTTAPQPLVIQQPANDVELHGFTTTRMMDTVHMEEM